MCYVCEVLCGVVNLLCCTFGGKLTAHYVYRVLASLRSTYGSYEKHADVSSLPTCRLTSLLPWPSILKG
jgi:hypothetical protein